MFYLISLQKFELANVTEEVYTSGNESSESYIDNIVSVLTKPTIKTADMQGDSVYIGTYSVKRRIKCKKDRRPPCDFPIDHFNLLAL